MPWQMMSSGVWPGLSGPGCINLGGEEERGSPDRGEESLDGTLDALNVSALPWDLIELSYLLDRLQVLWCVTCGLKWQLGKGLVEIGRPPRVVVNQRAETSPIWILKDRLKAHFRLMLKNYR